MKTIKVNKFSEIPANYTGIVEFSNGEKCWFLNGKWHREDGPAVVCFNGTKKWCLNGKCHREDGPAVEWFDGNKSYWLYGKRFDKEKINFWLNLGYPEKTAIKLEYYYANNKSK